MFNADRAKQLLDEQGRKRKWLAHKCGIAVPSLTRILNENRAPGRSVLMLMAIALDVPESELWTDGADSTQLSKTAPPSQRRQVAAV